MALSNKKRLILVKLESTYGADAVPVAADAVLCSSLDLIPLEGSAVDRNFIRPYFANSGSIRVENFSSLTFETEVAGSSTAGTAPEWGLLLKSSNFSETVTATAITGTTTAVSAISATTATLSVGATDDIYTGMTITFGSDTTKYEIVKFVAATKVATLNKPLVVATTVAGTFSIGANVIYMPNSNFGSTANTSASIYFNVDGVQHVLLGARGTVSFDLSPKAVPKMKWKYTGLLGTITDVPQTAPATNFTGWQTPVTVSTVNTTDISILGYNAAVIEKLTFDIANVVAYRQTLGSESVLITDRKPAGSISLEAGLMATKDWFTPIKTSATGVLCLKHGQTAGNIVGFTAPQIQLTDPKYSDSNGVQMLDMGIIFQPYGASGNDEIRICAK